MTRYAAFLRGVNLGKRQTKSADLKAAFESIGLTGVATLIASGNIVFETQADEGLQEKIETALKARFGFEIGVVLRTMDALKAMIESRPFASADPEAEINRHVLLFAEPMKPPLPDLTGVPGDFEVARLDPAEIFFIVYRKPDGTYLARSAIGDIDKVLPKGHLVTMRNWNTIEKAVAK